MKQGNVIKLQPKESNESLYTVAFSREGSGESSFEVRAIKGRTPSLEEIRYDLRVALLLLEEKMKALG